LGEGKHDSAQRGKISLFRVSVGVTGELETGGRRTDLLEPSGKFEQKEKKGKGCGSKGRRRMIDKIVGTGSPSGQKGHKTKSSKKGDCKTPCHHRKGGEKYWSAGNRPGEER